MHRTAAARSTRPVLLLVIAATLLSGCGLLYPGWPPRPIEGGMPEEIGRYTSGSATMTLSGGMDERVTLELVEGSNAMTQMGAQLHWRTTGWALTLSGYSDEPDIPFGPIGSFGSLQIDRLTSEAHWQTIDWDGRCDVEFERLDESGASGTASCQGLLWMDAIMGPIDFDAIGPPTIEGAEPIDVEIVFDALP